MKRVADKTRHLFRELEGMKLHCRKAGMHGAGLNFSGTREEYLGGLRQELRNLHPSESRHLDWERLSRAGHFRLEAHASETTALLVTSIGGVLDHTGVQS